MLSQTKGTLNGAGLQPGSRRGVELMRVMVLQKSLCGKRHR